MGFGGVRGQFHIFNAVSCLRLSAVDSLRVSDGRQGNVYPPKLLTSALKENPFEFAKAFEHLPNAESSKRSTPGILSPH